MSCDTIAAKEPIFCGEFMLIPEQTQKIFNLHSLGWGKKRIAKELGISTCLRRNGFLTVDLKEEKN